ncbi:hypothetical protein MKP05_03775 [Halomonas sp. EGI 63088]|uniref:Uncharacterized protein n=1 Tax=Halomonas flagellata TaxID=2920385 RepID=A0ABS9RQZ9_9GAMM|nr:hypothetical protein [Halomonas flagellata]MCH4562249.1 hypothetical protein [Halomonas flagellata]
MQAERLRRSQELLESSAHPVETIAELVGFPSAASLRLGLNTPVLEVR